MNNIFISIVVPAFNEAKRLPVFLDKLISYCASQNKRYEIIIVDDGSTDSTLEVVEDFKDRFQDLYAVKIRKNRGKGYAIKRGFLKAQGDICVFLDADGSVTPDEIDKNLHYITEGGYDVFIGSRVLKNKEQVFEAKWYRKLMGRIFNLCIKIFLFKNIKDTQCGFKMFRSEVVRPLFKRVYLRGFGFDMEVLYLAFKMGYRVKEGAVSWHHVDGSKINVISTSLSMFFNILQIKNRHYLKDYRSREENK
ncbi:MAG: glycosyltransferase family 2 protein [Candidatus Aadella gelida]|nr:glycosyltransferase family 2 protein [Candidatus Aadella gelida]